VKKVANEDVRDATKGIVRKGPETEVEHGEEKAMKGLQQKGMKKFGEPCECTTHVTARQTIGL
jgi:hypothetical protein